MSGPVAWRAGLLEGRRIVAVAPSDPVLERLAALGAEVAELGAGEAIGGPVDALVVDARAAFAAVGMRGASDAAWEAVRSVAAEAMIAAERPGKVVLVGPGPDVGEHAGALRAALENLARTLSTEWARYGITTAAVLPGPASREDEIAELVALLVSPAGAYFSGCRFELGGVAPAPDAEGIRTSPS